MSKYYQYNMFSGAALTPRPKTLANSQNRKLEFVQREYVTTGYRIGIAPKRITSTTIVECFPPKEKIKNENSLKNLTNNSHSGTLSAKALGKMANAVDWLLASAHEKKVFSKKINSWFKFRINFVTLTLPESSIKVDDLFFKNKLVKPFLNALRKYYKLNNYIWKLEFQKNGRLHLHITTDTFIHHETIRAQWNRVLKLHSLIDDFKAKYGHGNPNSTDIHSVVNIRDLAAYLMKYMSKQDKLLSEVKGRIWGCSQKLSKALKTKVIVEPNVASEYYQTLNDEDVEAYDVEATNPNNGKSFVVARIFKITHEWLRTRAHAAIRQLAHDVLLMLRGVIDLNETYIV